LDKGEKEEEEEEREGEFNFGLLENFCWFV